MSHFYDVLKQYFLDICNYGFSNKKQPYKMRRDKVVLTSDFIRFGENIKKTSVTEVSLNLKKQFWLFPLTEISIE